MNTGRETPRTQIGDRDNTGREWWKLGVFEGRCRKLVQRKLPEIASVMQANSPGTKGYKTQSGHLL